MNFNIVESPDLDSRLDEFVELYNGDELKCRDIIDEMNISTSNYRTLRKKAHRKGLLIQKKRGAKFKEKDNTYRGVNVCIHGRGFCIRRRGVYYGYFKNYEDAIQVAEQLKECDWDKSQVLRIKKEVLGGK